MTTTTNNSGNAVSMSVLIETTVAGGVAVTATTAAVWNKKIEAAATRQQPQSHPLPHQKVDYARCNTATIIPNVNCATMATCPDRAVAPLVRTPTNSASKKKSENAAALVVEDHLQRLTTNDYYYYAVMLEIFWPKPIYVRLVILLFFSSPLAT
jgi:hypothetical protein